MKNEQKNLQLYSLSHPQKRILFAEHMYPNTSAQVIVFISKIHGKVQVEALKEAIHHTINDHDVLRLQLVLKAEEVFQYISEYKESEIPILDFSHPKLEQNFNAWLDKQSAIPFHLYNAPLVHFSIVTFPDEHMGFVLKVHHSLCDGWSVSLVVNQIIEYYDQIANGKQIERKKSSYFEFLEREEKYKNSTHFNKHKKYWLEKYKIVPELIRLHSKSQKISHIRSARNRYELPEDVNQVINSYCVEHNTSIFRIFLASLFIYLSKLTSKEDIIIGTPFHNRLNSNEKKIVGTFVSTVPVYCKINHDLSFNKVLGKVSKELKQILRYLNFPYDLLIHELRKAHSLEDNLELFEIMLSYRNAPYDSRFKEVFWHDKQHEVFPLVVHINDKEQEGNLLIEIDYQKECFSSERIDRIYSHLLAIIINGIKDSSISVASLPFLGNDEKINLLEKRNDTRQIYQEKPLHVYFEEYAARLPQKVAVKFHNQVLTYGELNEKANSLARILRTKGVKPNSPVGLLVDRSFEMIIGILAILKSGGAYVPLDSSFPANRLSFMLNDFNAKILLTSQHLKFTDFDGDILYLEDDALYQEDKRNLDNLNSIEDLAYIIYTSGSTGNPKGTMTMHKNVPRVVKNTNYIEFCENDILLQVSNYAFDGSIIDFFGTFLNGATLVLIDKNSVLDMQQLSKIIENENISIFFITTTLFNTLVDVNIDCLKKVQKIIFGGERCSIEHVRRAYKMLGPGKLINGYGPTETTVFALCQVVEKLDEVTKTLPIGKPITNTQIYIVNKNLELLPEGAIGEICIGGQGVCKGYLNQPELTSERFVPNPFNPGTIMYKTGDLGRWLPEGTIDFIGRIDFQVKLRGFRIELGEIDNAFLQHEGVKQAVTVVREEEGKELCVYFTSEDYELTEEELRLFVAQRLPDYMIPAYFIKLEKLHLTRSGKVDRKQLPPPDKDSLIGRDYEPPITEIEKQVVSVWQEVLGRERIGINEHFFHLGGDSIKAIQVASRLLKKDISLGVRDILFHPTIKEAVKYVKKRTLSISQELVTGHVPLTPIQKWFFENNFTDMSFWNQTCMLYRRQGFDENILHKVFTKLIEHHDALRMVYRDEDGKLIQYNRDVDGKLFDLHIVDLTDKSCLAEKIELESQTIQSQIDLAQGPLVRLCLFRTTEGDHLVIAIHHLVIDGVSWRILLEDFETAYQQVLDQNEIEFEDKTTSYKEWSLLLTHYAESYKIREEATYWKELLTRNVKKLPRDFSDSEASTLRDTKTVWLHLKKEDTEKLLSSAHSAYHTEINDLLLVSLGLTLKEWRGISSFLITLEGHGREAIGEKVVVDRTVGWFTSQFPVLLDMRHSASLSNQIKFTKEELRKIPRKGIGYGLLTYLSGIEQDERIFNQEPEISFNYLGEFKELENNIFKPSDNSKGIDICTSPDTEIFELLSINGFIIEGQLAFSLRYSSKNYRQETIDKLATLFKNKLCEIIDHCAEKKESELTPSDYGTPALSIEELEAIKSYFSEQQFDIEKIYSLNPMQAGIHFHYLENKSSSVYFVQLVYTIQGNLQIDYLEKSLNHVINKYDALRTNIIYHKLREPLQIVLKERHTTIHFEDISTLHKHKQEKYIENFTTSDKEKGFDLSRDCLIRMSLLQTDDHEYRLILSFHHIIIDGWCYPILWDDLLRAYLSFMERTPVGEEYALPYYEYIRWLNNQNIQGGLDYWKKYLSGLEEKTLLPGMEKGTSQQYCAQELTVSINSETKKRLQEIASQHQTTLNVLFQVLWGMVLHRYTGKDDVVFGVVVSGRPAELEDVEKMVGIFINTMPIRINNNDCQIFTELLQHIGRETIESQKYAYVGLSAIQQQSIFQRELINHVIAFENYPLPEQMAEKETINRTGFHVEIEKIYEQPNYDFFLQLFPTEKLIIKCIFNSKLYNKKIVQNLIDYCVYLADLVCQVPDLSLHDERLFQLLPQEQQLIENINQTYRVFAAHKTIHQLFEEQVVKTPNALAVLSQGKQLTYQELNQRANHVASLLRKKGVKPNTVVALLVSRSEDMVIGLLSILKAGGAYLPLDPDFPQERISLMLERSKVSLLLVNSTLHAPSSYLGEILHLNDVVFDPENGTNPESMNSSEDLAYILFTSGSTGIPKGVMISHRAVNNFIKGVTDVIPFRNQNRIVALTTISFDIFVLETFLPLNKGATVVLADETQQKNIQKLGQLIVNQKVDRLQITPSRLQILLQNSECRTILEHIESIMVGGEAFPRQLLEKLKRVYKGRIFNMYGPTETTVWSSIKELTDSDYIDIGKPIANTQIYILNESHQLQPIGTAGELCIAGDGLSSGYLYDPEMTSSRFVPCPFKAEEKMYKTGDLARILPDGAIEFLGRMDYQVKVRGYRIESGEIEDAIAHFPGIQESVVITKKDPLDNTVLAAYYIAQTKLDTSEIQAFLSKKLPDYMVPSIFVHLYKFPLTPNGKIDRKALPELDKDTISISSIYSPPTTGLQGQLVSICKEILMNVKIGINDNFFQLGLNSLSVVTFHSKIEEFYPGKVMVTDFFAYPNISKLASYIEGKTSESIKQLSIKPLCLPHRYFRDSQNTNGEEHSLFTFDIKDDYFYKLTELAQNYSVELVNVLFALGINLFNEISDNDAINIQLYKSEHNYVVPIEINFNNIEDWNNLFHAVAQSHKNIKKGYKLENITHLGIEKKENEIITLFADSSINSSQYTSFFELIFEFQSNGNTIHFECHYNKWKFSNDVIEEILNYYIESISLLIKTTNSI